MPKRRKTLAELAESGSLDKNRGRLANRILAQSATAAPLGRGPKHLPETERKIWAEIALLAPPNLLQRSDRPIVEVACIMLARLRGSHAKTSEISLLMSLLGRLGMTPSDRVRLNLEPVPAAPVPTSEPDPWEGF